MWRGGEEGTFRPKGSFFGIYNFQVLHQMSTDHRILRVVSVACSSAMCSCVRSSHPRPSHCVGTVYRGCPCRDPPVCPPMPRQDGIGDKAPTLCCACVASSWHAHSAVWNCGVGKVCADCHEMSAPPLEWAEWSAQSRRIIISAMISSKLLMQHSFLLSSPSSSALSKHTISSPIFV